jgi:hypothetical protein
VVHYVSKVDFTVYTFILLIVDTHNKENPAKPTESASDVSDSGVSVTTSSSAYELDEINHEQKLVNKIDVKHTSDQTEKKINTPISQVKSETRKNVNTPISHVKSETRKKRKYTNITSQI